MTEAIALLDVLHSFAVVVSTSPNTWSRPRFNNHNMFVLKKSWRMVSIQMIPRPGGCQTMPGAEQADGMQRSLPVLSDIDSVDCGS